MAWWIRRLARYGERWDTMGWDSLYMDLTGFWLRLGHIDRTKRTPKLKPKPQWVESRKNLTKADQRDIYLPWGPDSKSLWHLLLYPRRPSLPVSPNSAISALSMPWVLVSSSELWTPCHVLWTVMGFYRRPTVSSSSDLPAFFAALEHPRTSHSWLPASGIVVLAS